MTSNYPNSLDTDATLPRVDNNITQIGASAINALRDAVFALEDNLGIGLAGNLSDLATRLNVSFDANGNIKPSALTSLALTPIVDAQVSPTAAIKESKLALDHKTQDLYNSIVTNNGYLQTALAFIAGPGSEILPHIAGTNYNHFMSAILVAPSPSSYFKNRSNSFRDNTNLYNLFSDFNKDLVAHEKADSTNFGSTDPTSPSVGTVPPANYAHVSKGIYLNTANFTFVPQTATDLQQFAEFIDNSNIFLLGTRIQTFYANGIPNTARSGTLTNPSLGKLIVPSTSLTTYLLNGGSSSPVDDIDHGDDIAEFVPPAASVSNSTFDAMFNQVQVGHVLTITYDGYNISVPVVIKEKKLIVSGGNKRYVMRLNSKNLFAGTNFTGTVNHPLFNNQKSGVLALSQAISPMNVLPTLVAGNPRGAQVLGVGFNPDQLDSTHYNLYLQLYPDGNPTDGITNLAAIDVTGNKGATPGQYTLDSIVAATNAAFRAPGFNYRFIAYAYQGQFGLMLAEPYGGASFSIISGILSSSGAYDQSLSNTSYPNNVIGTPGFDSKDALGFGPNGAGIGSPPFTASFANATVAQTPTIIFVPLTRDNYYVNGIERERFALEVNQILDGYGDGYWPATIVTKTVIPGVRVEVTYQVNAELSTSGLQVGKTLVIKSTNAVDSGRFFIKSIQFNNCDMPNAYALITVYDAIHGTGSTPFASAPVGTVVGLYFNGDSIGFNIENSTDYSTVGISFKRHFEIYVDDNGHTFSQERGRMGISGSNATVNGVTLYGNSSLLSFGIYKISSKLRGYNFSSVNKINFQITSYSTTTGIYSGYLCNWDGVTVTNQGPITVGKKGQVVRFYDQSNVEYIEFILDASSTMPNISTTQNIDIQLFPTLRLDEELMILGTVQVNDATDQLQYLRDERQFGNISVEQLSTSALDFIAAPTKYLHENGVIQGFDLTAINGNNISFNGGTAFVNGKIIQLGNEVVGIPVIQETLTPYGQSTTFNTVTWFVCLNDKGEIEFIASTDFDPATSGSTYDAIPVDHTRIFYALNPNAVSPTPYQIRSSFLSDIASNPAFKDVLVLAVVSATISFSSTWSVTSTVSNDARRFIYNGYSGLTRPFVFGANASFRSLISLNTWLTQLLNFKSALTNSNSVGTKVIVKGSNTVTSAVTLNYGSEVIFEGDGGTFTISSISTGFNLGSNITFRNLNFINAYDPIAHSDPNYTSGLLANNANAFLYCNVNTVSGNKNIKVDNCTFSSALQERYPFIVFNFTSTSAIVENVDIINNKFQTTFAADDKYAVISMIGPTVAPATITGARLINCNIINNHCNKNQLIQLSSPLTGGLVVDLIAAVNLQINNNTCGAINALTKSDNPTSPFNTTFSNDKNPGARINYNNCRFIYCGFGNGFIVDGYGHRPATLLALGLYTSPLLIENNLTSFIHVGLRRHNSGSPGFVPPSPNIVIRNNRLFADDNGSANGYLNSYYPNFTFTDGYSYADTAIIVDKAAGP